jgi:copper chaperone CopZ
MKNCGTTVQNALRGTHGVRDAVVDFPAKRATVWADMHKVKVEDLIDAVECVGFDASLFNKDVNSNTSEQIKLTVDGMMCQKNCGTTVKVS